MQQRMWPIHGCTQSRVTPSELWPALLVCDTITTQCSHAQTSLIAYGSYGDYQHNHHPRYLRQTWHEQYKLLTRKVLGRVRTFGRVIPPKSRHAFYSPGSVIMSNFTAAWLHKRPLPKILPLENSLIDKGLRSAAVSLPVCCIIMPCP